MASNGASQPNVSKARWTKQRSTNVLTSGGPKVMKEQQCVLEIVHVCILEGGNSLLDVFSPGILSS